MDTENTELQIVPAVNELPVDSPLHNLDQRITQVVPLEVIRQKVDDLSFQYAYRLCGHISLDDKGQLSICTNKAGSGTSHEEIGRCLRHDKVLFKPRSPYVQYLKHFDSLQAIFEEFQNREKKLNDLGDEINIARTVLSLQLQEFQKGKKNANDEVFKNVLNALELIRRIGETIANIQKTEASGITLQSITAFLWQISEILNQEILSPEKRIRVLDRIATETSFV